MITAQHNGKMSLLFIIPMILSLLGCSATTTAQPTDTPVVTGTPTPAFTLTPTKIPPPLVIYGCLFPETCTAARAIESYFGPDKTLAYNEQYLVTVFSGDEVRFFYEWCAIDRATLDGDKSQIEYVFAIDGVSYLEEIDEGYTTRPDKEHPALFNLCYSIGGVLGGWKVGKPHTVTVGVKLAADISDGWTTTPAGEYLITYKITPVSAPPNATATVTSQAVSNHAGVAQTTYTPSPSDTPGNGNDPIPTNTSRPPLNTPTKTTMPPLNTPTKTSLPPCDATGSLYIENGTSTEISISLSGPANYNFTLAIGSNTLPVCPGTYTYTATGCGSNDSGTVSDGETIQFFCTSP